MLGMNRTAHPVGMGDGTGSASGAEGADAAPAAVCGPQSGMACDCIGAESTGVRAVGWTGTPTNNSNFEMRISHATSKGCFIYQSEKLKPPTEACAHCTCLSPSLFCEIVFY